MTGGHYKRWHCGTSSGCETSPGHPFIALSFYLDFEKMRDMVEELNGSYYNRCASNSHACLVEVGEGLRSCTARLVQLLQHPEALRRSQISR